MNDLETEHLQRADTMLPSESAAAPVPAVIATPLQALLTAHILSDGEIVLLLLKPSPWFIVFTSLKFSAAVIICAIAAKLSQDKVRIGGIAQTATLLISGRVMWSTLQWMGRYYILTDLRILRVGGVFRVEIFACGLRKVARTRVLRTLKDTLVNIGQIEIIPQDEQLPIGVWQSVPRPRLVQEQIIAAIRKARHSGRGNGA
jgi:hypothetical protein